MESAILTNQELRIFAQQIGIDQIGITGQEKLKKTSVLVIGAGGIGVTVLQCLASSGIGILGISDNSLIQETDLPRYNIFGIGDLGKQKAIVTKEKLSAIHPKTTFSIHNIHISDKNTYQICGSYDIIVDATKHMPTSRVINSTCCGLDKPMVYGFIRSLSGIVTVFNFKEGHKFEDVFPEKDVKDEKFVPLSTIAPLINIISGYMAGEVIKIAIDMQNIAYNKIIRVDL